MFPFPYLLGSSLPFFYIAQIFPEFLPYSSKFLPTVGLSLRRKFWLFDLDNPCDSRVCKSSGHQSFTVLFFFSFWLRCIFVVAHGLSCPTACGILSPTRDRTRIFRIGRQNCWTTREVPIHCWVGQNAPSLGCYFQIGCSCSPGNTYTLFCSFIS